MNKQILCSICICILLIIIPVTSADNSVSDKDLEGHDAVVLFEKGIYNHAFTLELSKSTIHRKIKFLTQKGIEEYGTRKLYISPGSENISGIKGTVLLPDGKEVKIRRSDIFRKDIVKKSGRKMKEISIVFPFLEVGAIVDFTYDISFEGLRRISQWSFQDELYTVHSEISFMPWPTLRHGYTLRNSIEEPEMSQTKPGGHKSLNFIRKNIPALTKEGHSLPYKSQTESISFYYSDSKLNHDDFWRKWGIKYYKKYIKKLIMPCKQSQQIVRNEFSQYARDGEGQEVLIRALYDYVITHHFSVGMLSKKERENLDDNYWERLNKLDKSSKLFGQTYLSNRQMTYLLASLIKTALPKVDIKVVFYIPWDDNLFDPYLGTMAQFTDMMLQVSFQDKSLWLSPSKRFMEADMTPWAAKGIHVLVLDGESSDFEKIPLDKNSDNKSLTRRHVEFDLEEGNVAIKQREEHNQYMSYYLRSKLSYLSETEWKDYFEDEVKDEFGDEAELISHEIINLDDITKPMIVETEFKYPYEFEEAGNQILFRFPGFDRIQKNPFPAETRHGRICFRYPFKTTQEITYKIPEEFSYKDLPRRVRLNEGLMQYNIDYKKIDDHQFTLKCVKTLVGNMIKKEANDVLQRMYNKIMKTSNEIMILTEE